MREEGRISAFEAMIYQMTVPLSTIVLVVPAITVLKARQDAWLSGILACLFGFLTVFLAAKLALRFPKQTVIEYAPRILGGVGGKLVGLVYVYYFLFVAYSVQRQFGELMSTGYYPFTPLLFFIIVLTLLACHIVYLGLEVLCRLVVLWAFFGVSFFIILALVLKDMEIHRFLPFLESGVGPVIAGAITPGAWLGEMALILMILPFISDKRRVVRTSLVAVFAISFLFEIVVVASVGTMGTETVARMLFPYFSLYRRVHIATMPILDRQDPVLMLLWVGGMLFKLAIFFHAGVMGLGQWLGLKSHRPLIFPAGALLTALAVQAWGNITELVAFLAEVKPFFISFVNLVLTGVLLGVAVLRGVRDELPRGEKRASADDKKA
uniref:Spore gernimation protein n=1 Tax=Ammonifex degensii TaxID=42838 RepID=A0A7C2IEE4_9THEO